ncbi:hypothetical protein D3875_01205 [Deinococcus cavernae]|uniref:Uncharacterized protein n=1 Tax=Deinococcus cavernae TaxID=2320857 RepID=A0A418VHU2_9DEIO|nr:hypothetical protein D3875_01205 [Deinococcus cavernae]
MHWAANPFHKDTLEQFTSRKLMHLETWTINLKRMVRMIFMMNCEQPFEQGVTMQRWFLH